jgi:NTE family protein
MTSIALQSVQELVEGHAWREQDTWICAVRRRDGRRVVFGRPGTPEVPLHLAIAASCAVPGYFAPVGIGERTYVEGGAHSPTNAAILRDQDLDLILIVSPMSGRSGVVKDVYAASRWHAARTVRREALALRKAGVAVVVFRPGRAEQGVMGDDFMARDRVAEIVQESFLGAGAYAAEPPVRRQLNVLAGDR